MLKLTDVHAGYGARECLHGISLEVGAGEVVALLGANGAGKTTTLMAISGLVQLTGGRIELEGQPLAGAEPASIVRRGVSHVPEGRRILPRLTVLENLQLGAYARTDQSALAREFEHVFTLFPVLAQRRRQLAGTLSGGEQQMLAIGRGLMARPRVLLLDEPSLGLAPKLVLSTFEMIKRLHAEGMTILLVEQNAYQALQIADRAYVLETGRLTLSGPAATLANDPRVKSAYLGG